MFAQGLLGRIAGALLTGYPSSVCGREKRPDGFREFSKRGEIHLLLAVAQGLGGIRVHFDEQSVGAHGDRAAAERDAQDPPGRSPGWDRR